MATPPGLIQIALAAQLDESQADEVLDPTSAFPVLENVRQDRRGGLTKRFGFGTLTTDRLDATTRTAGHRLGTHRDLAYTIDGTYLDVYAEDTEVSVVAGRVPEASVTTRTLSSVSSVLFDCVTCNGYIALATLQGLNVLVDVETTDGVVVRQPEVVFTSTVPETAALFATYSHYIIIFFLDSSSGDVTASYLDTTSAATITTGWVSLGTVASDHSALAGPPTASISLSTQSLSNRVAFAYPNDGAGASRLTVKTLTISGVVETATVNTSSTTPSIVSIEGSIADTLWVSWNESTAIKLKGLDADSLSTTLATTATILTLVDATSGLYEAYVTSSATAGKGRILARDGNGLVTHMRGFQTTAGAVAADGSQVTIQGTFVDCRPFRIGTRYYGLFRSGDATNGVSALCDWTDALTSGTCFMRPVAWAFPGLTSAQSLKGQHPVLLSDTRIGYATPVARTAHSSSVELLTYDFADHKRWQSASHNGSEFLASGVLSYFDGRRVAECSFLHAPKKVSATDAGSGSGPNGSYVYVATFEEIDNEGNWCLSGVSLPSGIVTVTDNSINLSTDPLTMSARLSATVDPRVRVCFYRTLAGGEAPYYFVGSVVNTTTAAATLTDSTTDANLATARQLYGNGNLPGQNGSALDRNAPPFCQDVASLNGMLVVASGSDLWWSGQTVSGEHTWFNNEEFFTTVDGEGDIVAIIALDGTLIAWKRRSIYATAGFAPSDNGSGGGLSEPRRLACDVGCIDPRSILVTSIGVFFQSERGIELLSRSGSSVTWIGEMVQRTLATYPVVTSARLDVQNGLARFAVASGWNDNTGLLLGTGVELIYDLTLQQWQSVDKRPSTQASQDAAMITIADVQRYAWLGVDGVVHYERIRGEDECFLDGSTWITMALETGSFKTGGIQGVQQLNKLMVLARKATQLNLSAALSYNYETTFRTAQTWTRATIDSLLTAGWPITQLKHEPHVDSRCQGVRIRISDATPTGGSVGTGEGAMWIALTLDITPQPGVFDVPEGAT